MKLINDIIKEVSSFKRLNPGAFFYMGKDIPRKLQMVLEAITDDGFIKQFIIPCGTLVKNRVSEKQSKIISRYFKAACELNEARNDLVNMLTQKDLDIN